MIELKALSKESVPKALERAQTYRLLNEPWQAESICRDVLNVEPDNQEAILTLVLAITDQFSTDNCAVAPEAKELCKQLASEYHRQYYLGIISERLGKVTLGRSTPRVKYIAYDHYRKAMDYYEEAEQHHPDDNEETVLRWNACVRAIEMFGLVGSTSSGQSQMRSFLE